MGTKIDTAKIKISTYGRHIHMKKILKTPPPEKDSLTLHEAMKSG